MLFRMIQHYFWSHELCMCMCKYKYNSIFSSCVWHNYHLISLTCVASKIMEWIISRQIFHLLANNVFIPNHIASLGVKRRALTCLNHWSIGLVNWVQTFCNSCVYWFQLGFYTAIHSKLFDKLVAHGVSGSQLHWIVNFWWSLSRNLSWYIIIYSSWVVEWYSPMLVLFLIFLLIWQIINEARCASETFCQWC